MKLKIALAIALSLATLSTAQADRGDRHGGRPGGRPGWDNGGNHGGRPGHGPREVVITSIDNSNAEFTFGGNHGSTYIDLSRSGQYSSDNNIVPWLGASNGPGWAMSKSQEFTIGGVRPGTSCQLRLKFYATGFEPTLIAMQHRQVISQTVIGAHSINSYWVIPFTAGGRDTRISVTHNHHPMESRYANLDYLSVICY